MKGQREEREVVMCSSQRYARHQSPPQHRLGEEDDLRVTALQLILVSD